MFFHRFHNVISYTFYTLLIYLPCTKRGKSMNSLQRAWLYVTRKKGKTVLMFFILFVMATAIMSGISIKKASQSALQQARIAVGGSFSMYVNYWEDNPNIETTEKEGGFTAENNGPPLDEETIEKVAALKGLKGYNAEKKFYLQDNGFTPIEATAPENGSNAIMIAGMEDFPKIQITAEINSAFDSMFANGACELVEGKHFVKGDKNKILIHKAFADKNNLKLGDKMPLKISEVSAADGDGEIRETEVEIVGIFDTVKKNDSPMMSFISFENTFVSDVATYGALMGNKTLDFDQAVFYVEDPKEMMQIAEEAKALDIDWKQFLLDTNDEQYQAIAGSIESVEGLITTILYAVIIISGVILTLILSLWIKGRIHETGVLLSIGIDKYKIILQYIMELMMIAVLAFALSFLSGKAMSQSLANTMINQTLAQKESQSQFSQSISISSSAGGMSDEEKIKELNVDVTINELCYVYMIGSALIVISVLLSSISILRLKPKEILSKMS